MLYIGFLTLPWAFTETGYVLGTAVMIAIVVPSIIAAYFVLEAMARAEALSHCQTHHNRVNTQYDAITASRDVEGNVSSVRLWLVGSEKYEISEMCEMFLGVTGIRLFSLIASLYFYGTLAAYTTVFTNSCVTNFPVGSYSYLIYLAIFGLLVVPACCMELKDQMTLQIIYSYCRALSIILMITTALYPLLFPDESAEYQPSIDDIPTVNWSGLEVILPIGLYAYIFQHSIPSLAEPCPDKRQLPKIYIATLILVSVVMVLFSVVVSLRFGHSVQSSANLNWTDFTITSGGIVGSMMGKLISDFIVFFPPINVLSVYPLNAITLGNNLLVACGGSTQHSSQKVVVMFRLLAACPPLLIASFVTSLGEITSYTGITGFVLVFIFPPALAYASKQTLIKKGIPHETYYSNVFTSDLSVFLTIAFGVGATMYVSFSMVLFGSPTGR
jgi:hypothetical protein